MFEARGLEWSQGGSRSGEVRALDSPLREKRKPLESYAVKDKL